MEVRFVEDSSKRFAVSRRKCREAFGKGRHLGQASGVGGDDGLASVEGFEDDVGLGLGPKGGDDADVDGVEEGGGVDEAEPLDARVGKGLLEVLEVVGRGVACNAEFPVGQREGGTGFEEDLNAFMGFDAADVTEDERGSYGAWGLRFRGSGMADVGEDLSGCMR